MKLRRIKHKPEFDEFVSNYTNDAVHPQNSALCDLSSQQNPNRILLGLYENGNLKAAASAYGKQNLLGKFVYIDQGLFMDWQNIHLRDVFLRELLNFFKTKNYFMLKLKIGSSQQTQDVYKDLKRMGFRDSKDSKHDKEYCFKPLLYNLYRLTKIF